MTKWEQDLAADPKEEYQSLVRALSWKQGFGLLFIRCSPAQGEQLITRVRIDIPQKKIKVLRLEESIDNLYKQIDDRTDKDEIDILFIIGIEKSLEAYIKPGYGGQGDYYKLDSVPRILSHLNLQRERFRDSFNILFVFIVPEFAYKYFIRRAPDFFDWRSGVFKFARDRKNYLILNSEELEESIAEGVKLLASDRYEEAIASFDKLLDIQKDNHSAWNLRGIALGELGRYDAAVESYNCAIRIKPDKYEALNNRGIALRNLGRYEEAITSYNEALKIRRDKHETWYNKACCYALHSNLEQAIESLQHAIELSPEKYRKMVKTDPDFDGFREDERFQALIQKWLPGN